MAELHVVVCVAFDHRADAERLERFKDCICHCAFVEVAMEVSGTFDLIVQGKIATLADYAQQIARIRPQLAEFVTRIETNFVSKTLERNTESEGYIWVPCIGGRKRLDIGLIDKVIAEGDYMRLFVKDWNCLVHSTIRAMSERLDARFIQLHRSSIVRIDFIDRLVQRDRRWTARLRDGSCQAVAKSHVSAIHRLMDDHGSKDEGSSPAPDVVMEHH